MCRWWMVCLTGLLLQGPVWAEPVYSYQFDQANYTVAPGGAVTVQVWLQVQLAPGDTSVLQTEGLFSAGTRVEFDRAPLPAQPARVLGDGDIQPNAAFNDPTSPIKDLVPGHSAGLSEFGNIDPSQFNGVFGSGGPLTYSVLLGTFQFTAGLLPGEVTQLVATDFSLDGSETLTNLTGTVLDSLIADGHATITTEGALSAAPEPGSLGLMIASLVSLAVGKGGWRKRWTS